MKGQTRIEIKISAMHISDKQLVPYKDSYNPVR